ncbi:MAG TPA: thioredoxin family protein [Candidatus Cryptobacteroides merdipullorum]|uniref:Thioredoxin family protein n=1 Tax=Candidatus Cryptobacteroides merdipullorum TaxID=2840771 RepID=A0A9D1GNZ7_9BACT|nr:thioredoxin family protein [Candidatus Cryptobacteroides merdipullorum]
MLNLLFLTILLQAGPTVSWTSEVEQTEDGPRLVLTGEPSPGIDHVSGTVDFMSCIGTQCNMPEDWEFDVYLHGEDGSAGTVAPASAATPPVLQLPGSQGIRNADAPASSSAVPAEKAVPADESSSGSSLWGLILEAILWGFAMLLTPCVFPMVPMTISFFMKGSGSPAGGRFKAMMYGLFIVLLYTVPISAIIGVTWLVGGSGVTADIFNWLATHWLPNIIFFLVFMVFAASFFGAFEITLPSKWTNSADRNSDRKGLGGVFFLALTLVLVSFSCTGPIVGTVLIKSTQGEFWAPMVTMLAFSIAFALPFTIFALFPSLLKKLPKSGGWLNSVKVVLGFVEVALGLKFLSVADQTYHWGLLDREVYLAIWIVVFTLLGFYLLGKLRFKYDSPVEHLTVKRLALAIAVFSFVVYMIPGMWGAPLKALSGYLPPMETQDFVIGQNSGAVVTESDVTEGEDGMITIAHGLRAYDNLDDAVAAARRSGKRIFVDITGHGCVNCREMEARVWSDPEVLRMLREDFVILALYVDDKTKIPESEQIVTEEGRALKDVGRLNSYIALTRFGVNSQPNYFVLDRNGDILKGPRAYDLDIPAYIEFLSE